MLLPGQGTSIEVSLILLLWRTFGFLGFELNGTKERNDVEAVPFLRTQWTEIHRGSQMDTSREQICRRCLAGTNLHLSPIEGVCYQAASARMPSAAVSFHPQSTAAFHPVIIINKAMINNKICFDIDYENDNILVLIITKQKIIV